MILKSWKRLNLSQSTLSILLKPILFNSLSSSSSTQFQFQFPGQSSSCSTSTSTDSLLAHFASAFQSCIAQKALNPGKQLHARLCVTGLFNHNFLAAKLLNLYCFCDHLRYAHNLFDKMPKRNLFLWNLLIRAHAYNGQHKVAVSLFYRIFDYGLVPNDFTFPLVLKACSGIEEGRRVHLYVICTGWETDSIVGASLINMYARCGCVGSARKVFDQIGLRDIVVWNSMLAAYSRNGHPHESLSLCAEMGLRGLRLTEATLLSAISASADAAVLPRGRELHGFGLRHRFESNDKVKTALVDMYAKSGSLKVAREIFERLNQKRLVSWNAMITGYAMNGQITEAISLFEDMKKEMQPNHITFVGVLSACSRGGLLHQGHTYFKSMVSDYHINPMIQHYTCMVDLLGRSGKLYEAYRLIVEMEVMPDSGIWGALLNSCKIHRNVELGEVALDKLIVLRPNDAGNYVILSNMYAQAGKWEGVARVRKLMMERGLKKSIGCSWIEVKNRVEAFVSGDISHPRWEEIHAELKRLGRLMKEAGYVPCTGSVFHDVEDDEKSDMVCSHSERLAIAFGLISTPSGTRLLITKNLRVCEDCHIAIKFISRITQREISIRDVNRYHHFRDGLCSCDDYW